MNPRLPQLERYPAPWQGAAQRDTFGRVLRLSDSETDHWERVEVSMPMLAFPYRSDVLTGAASGAPGTPLQFLQVLYSPELPQRESEHPENQGTSLLRMLPTIRGACYLSAPGSWWILSKTGHAGGAPFPGKIPYAFVPVPSPEMLELWSLGHGSARPSEILSFSLAAGGGATRVFTVQQHLDGVRALQIRATNALTTMRFRTTGGAGVLLQNAFLLLEGSTLPFVDIYVSNGALQVADFSIIVHY